MDQDYISRVLLNLSLSTITRLIGWNKHLSQLLLREYFWREYTQRRSLVPSAMEQHLNENQRYRHYVLLNGHQNERGTLFEIATGKVIGYQVVQFFEFSQGIVFLSNQRLVYRQVKNGKPEFRYLHRSVQSVQFIDYNERGVLIVIHPIDGDVPTLCVITCNDYSYPEPFLDDEVHLIDVRGYLPSSDSWLPTIRKIINYRLRLTSIVEDHFGVHNLSFIDRNNRLIMVDPDPEILLENVVDVFSNHHLPPCTALSTAGTLITPDQDNPSWTGTYYKIEENRVIERYTNDRILYNSDGKIYRLTESGKLKQRYSFSHEIDSVISINENHCITADGSLYMIRPNPHDPKCCTIPSHSTTKLPFAGTISSSCSYCLARSFLGGD